MATQLPLLNLAFREGQRFESYYAGTHNRLLVDELQSCFLCTEHKQIVLWGTQDAGKSHLLQATCQRAHVAGMATAYLPLSRLSRYGTDVFRGTLNYQIICVDDIDSVVGHKSWQIALFNLINQAREHQQILLLSSSENPRHLNCSLPDLHSRLLWGTSFQVHKLDDDERIQALQHRAQQRGIELDSAVIEYIYKRYPRDFTTLLDILDKLDTASLSSKRKITIPLVKQVLENT